MEDELNRYFKCEFYDESFQKLKKSISLKEQSELYDYIYEDFIRNVEEYDENTIIPKLHLMLKLFTLTFYYRDILFLCDNCHNEISDHCLEWMFNLMFIEDLSTNEFIKYCFQFASMIDNRVKYDKFGAPIILEDNDGNTFNGCKISSKTLNKFFYCPLVGKAGNLLFHSLSKLIFESIVEKGFSKIPLALKTNYLVGDTSPHNNNVIIPIDMLTHDYFHSNGVCDYLSIYNISDLIPVYNSIVHNKNFFVYRMFSSIIWYIYFELAGFNRFGTNHKYLGELIKSLLSNNKMFEYVDNRDKKYLLKYLSSSVDIIPDDRLKDLLKLSSGYDQISREILSKYIGIYTDKLSDIHTEDNNDDDDST